MIGHRRKMRSDQAWRQLALKVARGLYFCAVMLTPVFVAAKAIGVDESSGAMTKNLNKLSAIAVPALAAAVAALGLGIQFGGKSASWTMIRQVLSTLRAQLFQSEIKNGDRIDHHRVTLFQKKGKYLLPVERSGDGTRTSSSRFLVPDNPEEAEGIAGQAFYLETILHKGDLPELTGNSSEADFNAYAENTWTRVDYVRRRKPTARSYCAIQVVVNRKPWGVVVVDSRNPDPKVDREHLDAYGLTTELIGTILES